MTRIAKIAALLMALATGPARAGGTGEERIVAVGGAVTEIIAALGAQGRIVAADTSSLYPADILGSRPNVGYMRALSAEGVLSVAPTRVIAAEGAGPPDTLRLLREAGVRVDMVSDTTGVTAIGPRIRHVGALLGLGEPAERLATQVEAEVAAVAQARPAAPRRVLFVLALANGKATGGGRNTAADAMIRLAGGVNALDDIEGYKPLSDEAIGAARPDVIFMMERPGAPAPAPEALFALPAFAATPAAERRALVAMDGLFALGMGPRTGAAARALARAFASGGASRIGAAGVTP